MVHTLDLNTTLTFELFDKGYGLQHCLGRCKVVVKRLLENQGNNSEVELALDEIGISIFLHVRREDLGTLAAECLGDSASLEHKLSDVPGGTVLESFPTQHLAGVLTSMTKLIGILDMFSRVHPYAHAAWSTISLVYKVAAKQSARDGKVHDLLATMNNLYSFVDQLEMIAKDHKRLGLHPALEDIVTNILKQTIECMVFIQEYSFTGFAGKAIKHIFTDADERIAEFEKAFLKLGSSLDTGIGAQTMLVSLRTAHGVRELRFSNTLKPVLIDFSSRPTCHPQTCIEMVKLITTWAMDSSSGSNVLWLSGPAGAGKSTLSMTITSIYTELDRLGAAIFFKRDVEDQSDPRRVIRTLAYYLSQFDERIAERVEPVVNKYANIGLMQIEAQFRELIKGPLDAAAAELAKQGSTVIVLDALDECGSPSDRSRLLSLLAERTAHLPSAFRFIITSRNEPDISRAFSGKAHVRHVTLEVDPRNGDIDIYLRAELADIAKKNPGMESWPSDEELVALAKRAEGLFIWASTACKYLDAYNPPARLQNLLTIESYDNALSNLNHLYITALTGSGDWTDLSFKSDCVAILGCILVAVNPVSPKAIDKLLGVSSLLVVSRLTSVLRVPSSSEPVRLYHKSFREFISDPRACDGSPWFIELDKHEERLADCCLRILQEALAKPINKFSLHETPDQDIDEAIKYACLFWIPHVCKLKSVHAKALVQPVGDFMKKNFIRWLETMSIMGTSRTTPSLLEQLHEWVSSSAPEDQDLYELTNDASRFAGFFTDSIAHHPGLISLTLVPFAPVESKLYQLYHDEETLPTVLGGYQKEWSPSLRIFPSQQLDSITISLAFSPDESKIVACGTLPEAAESDDDGAVINGFKIDISRPSEAPGTVKLSSGTVRVWDVMTGLEAIPSIPVTAIAFVRFSPDGSEIWVADTHGSYMVFGAGTGLLRMKIKPSQWMNFGEPTFDRAVISFNGQYVVFWDGFSKTLFAVDTSSRKEPSSTNYFESERHHTYKSTSYSFSTNGSERKYEAISVLVIHAFNILLAPPEIGPTGLQAAKNYSQIPALNQAPTDITHTSLQATHSQTTALYETPPEIATTTGLQAAKNYSQIPALNQAPPEIAPTGLQTAKNYSQTPALNQGQGPTDIALASRLRYIL
ncbi:hypothetical protein HGRIS_000629 [Hohenbuehelia grisea]|uniref:Nephrocystin 3-like N-terminal domain-containing protein n=1 Tax=Hohenbuehelia grisea TaxID=104357 RepID=A0ABR3JRK4_9AGAR